MNAEGQTVKKIQEWTLNPLKCVEEIFDLDGSPGKRISEQQREGLEMFRRLMTAKIKASRGLPMTPQELQDSKRIGIVIHSGHGCHSIGTPILMADGTIRSVESIQVGEQVMGDDSTPRTVLSLARGREAMYRIRYHDGTFYDVNASHKLVLVASQTHAPQKRGDVVMVSVTEYLSWSERKRRTHVGFKRAVEFPLSTDPLRIPPYILGLWLGDGSSATSALTNHDPIVIDAWREFGNQRGLNCRVEQGQTYKLEGKTRGPNNGNSALKDLQCYGLILNKHIPHAYQTASVKDRLELLAGLLDTDGHLDKRNRRVFSIIQKRESLARQIAFLCQSVGLHATVLHKKKHCVYRGVKRSGIYWEVSITRNTEMIPTRVPHKRAKPILYPQRNRLHFGFTVEPLGEGDYFGFSLDGNHLYLLGDCTVTRNTGKTAFLAWCIIIFLLCRPYCKIPCVAPVGAQLDSNLWPEIHLWLRRSPFLQDLIKWQAEKIYFKEAEGKEWFAFPRTISTKATPEEQAETLAGIHADNMLIGIDEGSGAADPVFKPLEGSLTGPCNFVVMIGNPTQSRGYFHDAFTKNRQDWLVCHWNAEESELVQKAQIERMARKYGRDSNAYRIRVLGLPPIASDDILIPYDWIVAAKGRDLIIEPDVPIVIGIDVARFGDDKSIILRRQGPIVKGLLEFTKLDSRELASWSLGEIQEENVACAAIDVIGWGAGTFDILNNVAPCPVLPVNVAEAASNAEQFMRLRDELWWWIRIRFQEGTISLPENVDDELLDELSCIKYNFSKTSKEKIKIESKQELRDRGVASPNKADALCLSEYAARFIGSRTRPQQKARPQRISAWVG